MNKNISPRNDKRQQHGYWEYYYINGKLMYKCVFINGDHNGFAEEYNYSNKKLFTKYYFL